MKKTLNIFRAIIVTLAVILIATPISLYVILSAGWAQDDIRKVAVSELSALLATDVSIGKVEIHPFNRLSIYDVKALDDNGATALEVDEISVAFELFYLLRTGNLVIDFALIDGPSLKLYKETADSPLNVAGIFEALKSDKPASQSKYDLRANTVIIRHGALKYDILDRQRRDSVFDPSHLDINKLYLNAYIPKLSNEEYRFEIDRFSFAENSGLSLDKMSAVVTIAKEYSVIEDLKLNFPNSYVGVEPLELHNKGLADLGRAFAEEGLKVALSEGSHIAPRDFAAFAPMLSKIDDNFELSLESHISPDSAEISKLLVSSSKNNLSMQLSAKVNDLKNGVEANYILKMLKFQTDCNAIGLLAGAFGKSEAARKVLTGLKPEDTVNAEIEANGKLSSSTVKMTANAVGNMLSLRGKYDSRDSLKTLTFKASGNANMANLKPFVKSGDLAWVKTGIDAKGRIAGRNSSVELSLDSTSVNFKNYTYNNISVDASAGNSRFEGVINIADPMLAAEISAQGEISGKTKNLVCEVNLDSVYLEKLNLIKSYADFNLSGHAQCDLSMSDIDDISGKISLDGLRFGDGETGISFNKVEIEAQPDGEMPFIALSSDIVNGRLKGKYRLSTLAQTLKGMTTSVFPALEPDGKSTSNFEGHGDNDFDFDFVVSECNELCQFFKLPVSVVHNVTIGGHVSDLKGSFSVNVDAPYLLQGDKIIETTYADLSLNSADNHALVYATTKMPTKKGPMVVVINMTGAADHLDNSIDWIIERKIPINGSINFSTDLLRDDSGELLTDIHFTPGEITFGDDIWSIQPSTINIRPKNYVIDNFALSARNKSISIDGIVSDNEEDKIDISLKNIALLDIFETLEIDKALIGGTATGDFTGRNLLSQEPELSCPALHVKDISYNRCEFGDADISAFWDNEKKAFSLDADITGYTGLKSKIYGDIFPAGEALDINFDVTHIPVGFLKPFMEAFAADLKGYASGKARLFGTFKYIDMEGDIFADDLKIKIDFTNTWYGATDSIKLQPGLIDIKNVTITDINGNTALLNGVVKHKFFKEPSFDFVVSNARNFLSYNVDSRISPDWYGTVYGNGGATISGEPGVVNIGVNMSTAPKSTFTFVLSDRLDADEYSFITFTDRKGEARRDSLLALNVVPEAIRKIRENIAAGDEDTPSAYNMDIQVDITPDARISLVMDPISGDVIKTTGTGNLRLTYGSLNNDLKMYGTYTLERGNYNFTLQDIIIKDFTIKDGSTIAFHGDPYSAQLDIEAIYAVNANLSDLDESFLLDKDLNRTNVPVHALLKVTGDMRQPDIDFDLEFPTLTQDTYRKVRSIVSTKDMMNRQIIYLLALNRFYTPDYMASTTKGNELFSVASSTISSQLSSMLGKLSDDWSIAPNLRSDRGDFSDIEVDVALSSRLLNNRLLFNGNFGYRDKTLNTNQFIGDFDIEYLLNPKGSWRLKAYNRYNDQNYYVRTAQTTQGIGLVFKKDFNNFFNFLHRKKKDKENDTTTTVKEQIIIPDSIAHPQNPYDRDNQ